MPTPRTSECPCWIPPRSGVTLRAVSERKIVLQAYTPRTDEAGKPVRKVLPYQPTVNPCRFCPGKCCHLNVKISLPEAVRYTAIYQLPFFSAISIVPSTHERRSIRLDRDPRFVDPVDGWQGRAELQLRRSESGACHALVDANGFKRCGIYPVRPSLCRLYPFSWESEDARGGPEMIMCPTPYALTPSAEKQFLEDVEEGLQMWARHEEVVQAWNARSGPEWTVEAFLEFAVPQTAERLGLDPTWTLSRGTADEQLMDQMVESGTLKPMGPTGGLRAPGGLPSLEVGPRTHAPPAAAPEGPQSPGESNGSN